MSVDINVQLAAFVPPDLANGFYGALRPSPFNPTRKH